MRSWFPAIALDSTDMPHVVWYELVGGITARIYYANQSNWTTTQANISGSLANVHHPALAIDSNDVVHVVCEGSAGGNVDTYYFNSASWSTQTNVSNSVASSTYPLIAIGTNSYSTEEAHVAWLEGTTTITYEAYYSKEI